MAGGWGGGPTGAYSSTTGEQPDGGRGAPGWKVTARGLGWNTLPRLNGDIALLPPSGADEAGASAPHLNQSKPNSLESKFLRTQAGPRNPSGGKTSDHQFVVRKGGSGRRAKARKSSGADTAGRLTRMRFGSRGEKLVRATYAYDGWVVGVKGRQIPLSHWRTPEWAINRRSWTYGGEKGRPGRFAPYYTRTPRMRFI